MISPTTRIYDGVVQVDVDRETGLFMNYPVDEHPATLGDIKRFVDQALALGASLETPMENAVLAVSWTH